jgi:teichoic acid transport system permease protein
VTTLYPDPAAVPDGMIRLGIRQPLSRYLGDIWARRDYLVSVARGDLHAQNYDTVLGNLWHIVDPLLQIGVYFLVFGAILQTDRGIDNFIAFLAVGVFTFSFTQKTTTRAAKAISANEGLIRSLRFPRAILPLTTVLTEAMAQAPKILIMLLVTVLVGELPTFTWLVLVPILALQVSFNAGLAFIAARLNDAFRDFENVLPYLFRIAFYLSGIIYSVDNRVQNETYRMLFTLNPFYCFPEAARRAVFGEWASGRVYVTMAAWSVALVVGGFLYFRSAEHRYGRG